MPINYVNPTWFYGIDTLFEVISLMVAFLVGYFGYKAYKLTNDKKYLYFASAFFIISVSFFIKIITNVVVEYQTVRQMVYGLLVVTMYTTKRFDLLYWYGLILYKMLMISALIIIFLLSARIKDAKIALLLFYFAFLASVFSHYSYYVYHTTSAFLFAMIAYCHSKNSRIKKIKKRGSANFVNVSFILLFLSQISFIFISVHDSFYVIGEIIQLTGYLFLLYAFILVLKK